MTFHINPRQFAVPPLIALSIERVAPVGVSPIRGRASFWAPAAGVTLMDCPLFDHGGHLSVGLPARPQLDRHGQVVWDERMGPRLLAQVAFDNHCALVAFSTAAVEAILAVAPDAFATLTTPEACHA